MSRHRDGFTLVEILIAIFVMMVGILGVMALFPVGLRASGATIERTNASMTARSALALMERENIGAWVRLLTRSKQTGLPDDTWFPFLFPADFDLPSGAQHVIGDTTERVNLGWPNAQSAPARLLNPSNPQYSWDARLDHSRTLWNEYITNPALTQSRIFRELYEVVITVYRNYNDVPLGNINLVSGEDHFTYSASGMTEKPAPGWWVRPIWQDILSRDRLGDWYEIQKVEGQEIKVDRPINEVIPSGTIQAVMTRSIVTKFYVLLSNQDMGPNVPGSLP